MKAIILGSMFALLAALSGCGNSHATGPTVEVASAPLPGFTCFAFKNTAGDVVGGNCVRDQ